MGGIGAGFLELSTALVVEIQHQRTVAVPALDGGDVIHVILFPQAAGVPERSETALGRHTGSCQHNDSLFHASFISK